MIVGKRNEYSGKFKGYDSFYIPSIGNRRVIVLTDVCENGIKLGYDITVSYTKSMRNRHFEEGDILTFKAVPVVKQNGSNKEITLMSPAGFENGGQNQMDIDDL